MQPQKRSVLQVEDIENHFLVDAILYGQNTIQRAQRKVAELARFLVHHLVVKLAYGIVFERKLGRRQRKRLF